jgi:hypothetical protein
MFLTVAAAHVGQPIGGIDLAGGADGLEIEATWGLLVPDDAGWRWVCHEAVTVPGAQRSPRYTRGGSDRLAWLPDPAQGRDGFTLFHSPDGCVWDPVAGSDAAIVRDAAFDPSDPSRAWVAAGSEVWRSSDGGATFTVAFTAPGRTFRSVRAAPGGAVAGATDLTGAEAFLLQLVDGAVTEVALPGGPGPIDVRLGGTVGDDVLVVVDPFGPDRVVQVGPSGVTTRFESRSQVTDVAADGGTLWVLEDGMRLSALRAGRVDPVEAWPLGAGLYVADGVVWGAPQSWVVGALVTRSTDDGATFSPAGFPDDVVEPLACAAGTPVATTCAPLWATLLPQVRGFDSPPVDSAAPPVLADPDRPDTVVAPAEPRGCSSTGVPALGWGAAVVAAALRRRSR